MNEALRVCDAKVGHCAISDLTGIRKVVDLTSCDVAEVRRLESDSSLERSPSQLCQIAMSSFDTMSSHPKPLRHKFCSRCLAERMKGAAKPRGS